MSRMWKMWFSKLPRLVTRSDLQRWGLNPDLGTELILYRASLLLTLQGEMNSLVQAHKRMR